VRTTTANAATAAAAAAAAAAVAAGMWILLKTPHNRKVLGQAMQVNPAASKLVKGMVNKIQDTIDVAEVGEQVRLMTTVIITQLVGHSFIPTYLQPTCCCSWRPCGVIYTSLLEASFSCPFPSTLQAHTVGFAYIYVLSHLGVVHPPRRE
jgi:hypothetical protein